MTGATGQPSPDAGVQSDAGSSEGGHGTGLKRGCSVVSSLQGYCYVNYSTPDAAAAAVEQLNGIEFPAHSGHRIKVMFAEPMGIRGGGSNNGAAPIMPPLSGHSSATSLPSRSPGVLSMHGGSMQVCAASRSSLATHHTKASGSTSH